MRELVKSYGFEFWRTMELFRDVLDVRARLEPFVQVVLESVTVIGLNRVEVGRAFLLGNGKCLAVKLVE